MINSQTKLDREYLACNKRNDIFNIYIHHLHIRMNYEIGLLPEVKSTMQSGLTVHPSFSIIFMHILSFSTNEAGAM